MDSEKLRGGFYSPDPLVFVCLDRILEMAPDRRELRFLEPSAGDGAFLRGLSRHPLGAHIGSVTAIEVDAPEAQKCRRELVRSSRCGRVLAQSALDSPASRVGKFDVAAGNPPFLRFQFVRDADRQGADALGRLLGIDLASVGNLWIPVMLSALSALRPGGVFSFIIPTESLTGVSAKVFRLWLLKNTAELHVDLFEVGSFPGVLQEVLVLSGRRVNPVSTDDSEVLVTDHSARSTVATWSHRVAKRDATWTGLLIHPKFASLREEASALPKVHPLGDIAKFSVSTVTGANKFFTVTDEVVKEYGLNRWKVSLLSRIRHAEGLEFTADDHDALSGTQVPRWLLNFSSDRPDPLKSRGAATYIHLGEDQRLDVRYKTSIRTPWFRVPVVSSKALLMSKRSHRFPRVVANSAGVLTTDTIYQAALNPAAPSPKAVAACFHNSLTLLSAELEGRSLGGGVLELVPSEIARLLLPVNPHMGEHFERLDRLVRDHGSDAEVLIEETDRLLLRTRSGLTPQLLDQAREARDVLLRRRLDRSESPILTEG